MDSWDGINKEAAVSRNQSGDTTEDTNNNTYVNTFNDNTIVEKSDETNDWTVTSFFGKLTQLRACLTLIQDNSIAIQNYLTTVVQSFLPQPKSPINGIHSPLLAFSKDRIALEKAVENLANSSTDFVNTASLALPVLSYNSLKSTEERNDDKVMATVSDNPNKDITAVKTNVDTYVGVDSTQSSIDLVPAYKIAAQPEQHLCKSDCSLNLNQDNSTKQKKGCCCFGSKKKTNKGEEDTMNLGEISPVIAVAPVANTTNLADKNIQFSKSNLLAIRVTSSENTQYPLFKTPSVRRTRVTDRPNISISLWSILKNCIGKDITKMPLPVNFSEPLSMLQRLTEDYEYSGILNTASKIGESCEQMVYVAAFTISSYATTTVRTNKPFNPLLGETFECDRTQDLGWRCINEKVCHHPPCIAQHCEGKSWTCWQQFSMTSKFHTNSLNIIPLGTSHLLFGGAGGNHYTWRKVTTVVHNIMFGKLWVGQEGDMTIVNHVDGTTCVLKYLPPESGGNDAPKKVTGEVFNKKGELKWKINGLWDTVVEAYEVLHSSPEKLGPKRKLWARVYSPEESEKYYNFTELACQLNQPEEGVAPTDSRLRPDQRFMENGLWDDANNEKRRLEDKQRASRRKYSRDSKSNLEGVEPGYNPAWFTHITDPLTGISLHIYNGNYWPSKDKQDWKRCLDIFS